MLEVSAVITEDLTKESHPSLYLLALTSQEGLPSLTYLHFLELGQKVNLQDLPEDFQRKRCNNCM